MTKPSRRSSAASALFRARPLRLALPALAVLIGFGLFVSGCGDDPAPTTPAPTPTPTPPTPPPPPGVPTGLQVASSGPDYIEWTWTAVEGATAYDVQMSQAAANDFTSTVNANDVTETSRRFTVPAETTRWARVRAKSANGESDWSDAVQGTSTAVPLVLTAPANVRVAEKGPNFIEWTWDVVADASAYEVQMSLNDADFSRPDETLNPEATASPKARFTVGPETTAFLRVRAVAGTGAERMEGPWSSPASEGESDPLPAPTGLEVSSAGHDYIEWTWTEVEGATAYDVQMSQTAENDFTRTQLANGVTETSRRFTVPAETTRWARVRARSGNIMSDWSEPVRGMSTEAPLVLAMPTGLEVADRGHNFIEWTWNVVAGATAYEVQTRENNANFGASDAIRNTPAIASPKWRLTVEPETTHYLRVRAIAGTGADRVEGDWALPVEGNSDPMPIGIPTGLAVSDTGTDFIEWSWRAVPGATGYTVEWDTTDPYDFSKPTRGGTAQTTTTTHRVSNLTSGFEVHLRVRATVGSRSGEWSRGVGGESAEPQPEPIGTPTGLAASGVTRSRVSLDWNDVTNAENYEVEQRAGSGSWVDTTCDESGDNEVDESECTATDLESGTNYQFRVRAVPDDDEALLRPSAWATVSATTTGRTTGGTGTSGGAGELNITWLSTASSITWNWDQAGRGVRYQAVVLQNVLDLAAPCEDRSVTWGTATFPTSHTAAAGASEARLLCVRTATTDNDGETTYGTPSWSWAATAPSTPTTPFGNFKDDLTGDQAGETDSLTWNAVSFSDLPHFEYEFRYIVDEVENDTDDWTTPDVTVEQRTCDAADVTETIEPSGSGRTTFTSNIDLEPYAAYRMCYRVVNDDGESDWAHSFASPAYTRPIKPAVSGATITNNHNQAGEQGNSHFRGAWTITANTNAPRVANTDAGIIEDYTVVMARSSTAQTDATVRAACQLRSAGNATPGFFSVLATADHIRPPSRESSAFDVWFTFQNSDADNRSHYYVCARTKDVRGSSAGQGTSPWVVSQGRAHGGSN